MQGAAPISIDDVDVISRNPELVSGLKKNSDHLFLFGLIIQNSLIINNSL